jgi:Trk-type K+ transport system membrane component
MDFLIAIFISLIAKPLVFICGTPFVLVYALFGEKPYRENLKDAYRRISKAYKL